MRFSKKKNMQEMMIGAIYIESNPYIEQRIPHTHPYTQNRCNTERLQGDLGIPAITGPYPHKTPIKPRKMVDIRGYTGFP